MAWRLYKRCMPPLTWAGLCSTGPRAAPHRCSAANSCSAAGPYSAAGPFSPAGLGSPHRQLCTGGDAASELTNMHRKKAIKDFGVAASVLGDHDSRTRLRRWHGRLHLGPIAAFALGHFPMLKPYWPATNCPKNFSKIAQYNLQATQKGHRHQIANRLIANKPSSTGSSPTGSRSKLNYINDLPQAVDGLAPSCGSSRHRSWGGLAVLLPQQSCGRPRSPPPPL